MIAYQKTFFQTILKSPWFATRYFLISKNKDISNFRPVTILTSFSKMYEKVTKRWIDAAIEKYLLLFLLIEKTF